jgi:hypothetical protein
MNVQWIGGYWAYDPTRDDHVWVSGVWRAPPPGRQWVSGYWTEAKGGWQRVAGFWTEFAEGKDAQEIRYVARPPAAKAETPGTPPTPQSFYLPGSWVPGPSGYVWQAGQWTTRQPGWIWAAPRYAWTPGGYTFTRGHWDHAYERRGWAFAPLRVPHSYRTQAGYLYRPSHLIAPGSFGRFLSFERRAGWLALRQARYSAIRSLPPGQRMAVSAQLRADLRALHRGLHAAAIQRRHMESRLAANPSRSAAHASLKLPAPRTPRNAAHRVTPPPHPTAVAHASKAGTLPASKTGHTPAANKASHTPAGAHPKAHPHQGKAKPKHADKKAKGHDKDKGHKKGH